MKRMSKTKPLSEQTLVLSCVSDQIGIEIARQASLLKCNLVICSEDKGIVDHFGRQDKILSILVSLSKWNDFLKVKEEALNRFKINDTWINCGISHFDSFLLDGGVIINFGTDISEVSNPLKGIYLSSKEALRVFTDSFRSQIKDGRKHVDICLIRPDIKLGVEVNAQAVLRCAVWPKRDVYVGGPARLVSIMDTFFPELKDMMLESELKSIRSKQ